MPRLSPRSGARKGVRRGKTAGAPRRKAEGVSRAEESDSTQTTGIFLVLFLSFFVSAWAFWWLAYGAAVYVVAAIVMIAYVTIAGILLYGGSDK